MKTWLGASLLVAGFLGLVRLFHLIDRGRDSLTVVHDALARLADRTLDDDAKERAMRRQSFRLFGLFGILALGGVAAFLLPLAGLWLLDRAGVFDLDTVMATALSWPFLVVSGLITTVALWWFARAPAKQADQAPEGFEIRYSTTDRLLHQIAFATTPVQAALARVEDRVFRRRLESVALEDPVFICALPRAGTTLLLDLVAAGDGFVTHTYRCMPFVHVPLFWERFARAFRTRDVPRERAHGDGMMVSLDSPEALEETLWLDFWSGHYLSDRIQPWSDDEPHPEFVRFLQSHMRKLALARHAGPGAHGVRYVSKNNLNIARVGWLRRNFPAARILVPYREPLQHAASLLRQHLNFLEIHRRDDFARQYMAAIGHFDFGANLRPIDFGGWLDAAPPGSPLELRFWLSYWTAAHRHLLEQAQAGVVQLLDYDALCAAPDAGLSRLAVWLGLSGDASLTAQGSRIRIPKPHRVDGSGLDPETLGAAREVHAQLASRALA